MRTMYASRQDFFFRHLCVYSIVWKKCWTIQRHLITYDTTNDRTRFQYQLIMTWTKHMTADLTAVKLSSLLWTLHERRIQPSTNTYAHTTNGQALQRNQSVTWTGCAYPLTRALVRWLRCSFGRVMFEPPTNGDRFAVRTAPTDSANNLLLIYKTAVYTLVNGVITHQKQQISKMWYYTAWHCLSVNVLLSNITFLIFAVFYA